MRIKAKAFSVFMALLLSLVFLPSGFSADMPNLVITVITASNEGGDFDMDNDAHRDRLIQLFSYSAYRQVDQFRVDLKRAERNRIPLEGGYELVLTLQNEENDRILVEALIRKNGTQFVNTVLSIMNEGVAFLGGPPMEEGTLILVLERI